MDLTYHSPCLALLILDWPSGRYKVQAQAQFRIETHPTRGQRAVRQTQHPLKGTWSAPKTTTYAAQARIVTGSDGKTYILELSHYGSIHVMQGNLQFSAEHIMERDPRYNELIYLFTVPVDATPVPA